MAKNILEELCLHRCQENCPCLDFGTSFGGFLRYDETKTHIFLKICFACQNIFVPLRPL